MGSWTPQSVLFNPVEGTRRLLAEKRVSVHSFLASQSTKEFCLQSILCYTSLLILGETFKKNIDRQKIFEITSWCEVGRVARCINNEQT